MWSATGVIKCWLTVALLSIPMTVAGEQEKGRSLSIPKTPDVASEQPWESKRTILTSAQNSSPDEIASAAQTLSDAETNEQFDNSPSLKWMAGTLRINMAAAYRLSVAFNFVALVTLTAIPLRSKCLPYFASGLNSYARVLTMRRGRVPRRRCGCRPSNHASPNRV